MLTDFDPPVHMKLIKKQKTKQHSHMILMKTAVYINLLNYYSPILIGVSYSFSWSLWHGNNISTGSVPSVIKKTHVSEIWPHIHSVKSLKGHNCNLIIKNLNY